MRHKDRSTRISAVVRMKNSRRRKGFLISVLRYTSCRSQNPHTKRAHIQRQRRTRLRKIMITKSWIRETSLILVRKTSNHTSKNTKTVQKHKINFYTSNRKKMLLWSKEPKETLTSLSNFKKSTCPQRSKSRRSFLKHRHSARDTRPWPTRWIRNMHISQSKLRANQVDNLSNLMILY